MAATDWYVRGQVVTSFKTGAFVWECTVYHNRRFWFREKVAYRTDTAFSKEAAAAAIQAFVRHATGLAGYTL